MSDTETLPLPKDAQAKQPVSTEAKSDPLRIENAPAVNAPASTNPPAAQATAGSKPAQPVPQAHRWRVRHIAIIAVLLVVASGLFYLWSGTPTEETRLVLQGNIDVRQVNLAFKVDGRLDKLLVDEGDHVKRGQLLASLDKSYFDDDLRVATARRDSSAAAYDRLMHGSRPEEIAQARALTAEREATVTRAQESFKRAEKLIASKAMAAEDFDRVRSDRDESMARLKQARDSQKLVEIGPRAEDIAAAKADLAMQEAAVIQSKRRLSDSELFAPSDGIILTRARERGAILPAGDTVLALTLASPVWVRTYVNERDLGLIREGMTAEVYTDSSPGHPYIAQVGFISPTAEFTPKTVETRQLRTDLVYNLRVVVANPDGGLRQGMPVTTVLKLAQSRPLTFSERLHKLFVRLHLAEGELP